MTQTTERLTVQQIARNTFTELQEKCLTALESGEYKQASKDFCRGGAYCCLAVATHVFDPTHKALVNNGWVKEDYVEEFDEDELERFGPDEMTAPPEVIIAMNLASSEGKFRALMKYRGGNCLIDLNDRLGLTFPEIAAFIRSRPWLVFTNFDLPEAEIYA